VPDLAVVGAERAQLAGLPARIAELVCQVGQTFDVAERGPQRIPPFRGDARWPMRSKHKEMLVIPTDAEVTVTTVGVWGKHKRGAVA